MGLDVRRLKRIIDHDTSHKIEYYIMRIVLGVYFLWSGQQILSSNLTVAAGSIAIGAAVLLFGRIGALLAVLGSIASLIFLPVGAGPIDVLIIGSSIALMLWKA